jgi:hypothetical protein
MTGIRMESPMEPSTTLTTGGWIFLISAWHSVSAFTVYYFYKVARLDENQETDTSAPSYRSDFMLY